MYERIQALVAENSNTGVELAVPTETGASVAEGHGKLDSEQPPPRTPERRAVWLSPFELSETTEHAQAPAERASNKGCLAMSFAEYLNLLDWTGRQLREDKRGAIPQDLAPILERLQVNREGWLHLIAQFRRLFRRAAGRPQSLLREREQHGGRLMQGIRHSRAVFF